MLLGWASQSVARLGLAKCCKITMLTTRIMQGWRSPDRSIFFFAKRIEFVMETHHELLEQARVLENCVSGYLSAKES